MNIEQHMLWSTNLRKNFADNFFILDANVFWIVYGCPWHSLMCDQAYLQICKPAYLAMIGMYKQAYLGINIIFVHNYRIMLCIACISGYHTFHISCHFRNVGINIDLFLLLEHISNMLYCRILYLVYMCAYTTCIHNKSICICIYILDTCQYMRVIDTSTIYDTKRMYVYTCICTSTYVYILISLVAQCIAAKGPAKQAVVRYKCSIVHINVYRHLHVCICASASTYMKISYHFINSTDILMCVRILVYINFMKYLEFIIFSHNTIYTNIMLTDVYSSVCKCKHICMCTHSFTLLMYHLS